MTRALTFLIFAIFAQIACAYEVRDARGVKFVFDDVPTAATVVPSITQSIYAIGADGHLIANSRYCVYPEDAKNKAKIGGFIDPDYEKIAELKPQIFILLGGTGFTGIENRLESLGIKCFVLNKEGLENIAADIRLLGALFKQEAAAEKVAKEIEAATATTAQSPDSKWPRALFVFGKMAAGKGSYVGGLLNACGLENCADATGKRWPVLSKEFIVASAPEIIFAELPDESSRQSLESFYKTDPIWRTTPAVKNGRVYFVPRDIIGVPGPRVVEALKLMREFCGLPKKDAVSE